MRDALGNPIMAEPQYFCLPKNWRETGYLQKKASEKTSIAARACSDASTALRCLAVSHLDFPQSGRRQVNHHFGHMPPDRAAINAANGAIAGIECPDWHQKNDTRGSRMCREHSLFSSCPRRPFSCYLLQECLLQHFYAFRRISMSCAGHPREAARSPLQHGCSICPSPRPKAQMQLAWVTLWQQEVL